MDTARTNAHAGWPKAGVLRTYATMKNPDVNSC